MAKTGYQENIYRIIDCREEVKEKFEKLVDSTNDDLTFSKNQDGSMAIYTKYKDYDIAINITQKEVFRYIIQHGRKTLVVNAIEQIIEEKIIAEILKEE